MYHAHANPRVNTHLDSCGDNHPSDNGPGRHFDARFATDSCNNAGINF
jgi:hypothetical protein